MKTKFETDVDETDEDNEDDWFSIKTSFAKKASSVKKASFVKRASSAKKANDLKETTLISMMLMTFVCLYLILYLSCLNDWSMHLSMIDLTW